MENTVEENKVLKTKTNDLLSIDPRNIVVDEEKNVRTDYGDIQGLMESLLANGQEEPIKVVKIPKTDTYRVTNDGYRRMRAINLALSLGHAFPYVKAIIGSGNEEDCLLSMVITGTGKKPLTMLEEAEAYKRLKAFGYDVKEIAQKVSKTQQHIYNLLKLSDLPKEVKNRIQAEEITGGAVLAILKNAKTADDLLKAVDDAVKNAVEEDKAKGGTGTKVKAKASNAGVVSAKKTLELALAKAEELELANAPLLKKLVVALQKGYKVETIARYFE